MTLTILKKTFNLLDTSLSISKILKEEEETFFLKIDTGLHPQNDLENLSLMKLFSKQINFQLKKAPSEIPAPSGNTVIGKNCVTLLLTYCKHKGGYMEYEIKEDKFGELVEQMRSISIQKQKLINKITGNLKMHQVSKLALTKTYHTDKKYFLIFASN